MSPSITITTTNQEASMVYTTSYPSGSRTEWVDGVAIVPASVTGSIVIKTGKQSPGVAFGLETETFRNRTNAVGSSLCECEADLRQSRLPRRGSLSAALTRN
jgi:hypothetical protein